MLIIGKKRTNGVIKANTKIFTFQLNFFDCENCQTSYAGSWFGRFRNLLGLGLLTDVATYYHISGR